MLFYLNLIVKRYYTMNKLLLITALAGLTLSLQANAAGSHRKGLGSDHSKAAKAEYQEKKVQKKLEEIDSSGDEKIDLNEYLSYSEKRFTSTDANSDGFITPDEMRAWSKAKRSEIRAARKAEKEAAAAE